MTEQFILSFGTLRDAAFGDRVAAAAAAGVAEIGLHIGEYLRMQQRGWTDKAMMALLNQYTVRISEIEMIAGFAAEPGPAGVAGRPQLTYADPVVEQAAFAMADAFGCRHLQAVGAFAPAALEPNAAEAFGALCDRAAAHDLLVALEFVPYTNVPDVATAHAIVSKAARPNGGLCVDSWHFFRGCPDFRQLTAVDGGQIFMVQLNDGPQQPDTPQQMDDAVHNRRLPGEGDFELQDFLRALNATGCQAPISIEVYSDPLSQLPSMAAARVAADATRQVLARVGSDSAGPA
jgi:sugar phosphate isomerase/epimerase